MDIGSSAVRAAEIAIDGNRPVLRRFAQVPVERGSVVDGEVVKPRVVGDALRRLWDEGKFSTQKVVIGVSSQRVIVRPAEVAAMPADDFRMALQFEAQELIPMPVEDAVLDFSILDPAVDGDAATGGQRMRILLAAGHREMVKGHLEALKLAGLDPVAVDLLPLALLRGVAKDPGSPDGTDAVVSLGSDLTTVAIRSNGVPQFARTVGLGGSKVTNSIAKDLSYEADAAETLKRDLDAPVQVLERVRQVIQTEINPIVNEVNSSIDYYLAQSDVAGVDRVVVTGGACMTDGLLHSLARHVDARVMVADPMAGLILEQPRLSPETAVQALAPIGLALWGLEEPSRRLSLLPPEVLQARQQKRATKLIALSLVGLALILGGAWTARHLQVSQVQRQVAAYTATNQGLKHQLGSLTEVTTLKSEVAAQRGVAAQALKGDVDWVRLLGQLAAVMPPDQALTSFQGSSQAASTSPSTSAASSGLGTIQVTVTGRRGQESVAQWLRALAKLPSVSNVTVSGSTYGSGVDTFNSTATLSTPAQSSRAAHLPGAQP